MQTNRPTFGVKFLLFILFFLGIALTALVILDAELFHWFVPGPGQSRIAADTDQPIPREMSSKVDQLRQSIVLVIRQDCDNPNSRNYGTGFVVKTEGDARYIATNAHVVRDALRCNGITIFDYKKRTHQAQAQEDWISKDNNPKDDLAILKIENITGSDMPALPLLNSSEYESGHDGEKIVTIGYPVLGVASTPNKASISSEGHISQYDTSQETFIASGLSLNPGNSGGPIFLVKNSKVLGIAVTKAKIEVAENVGRFIPINRFKNFFKEKAGKEL